MKLIDELRAGHDKTSQRLDKLIDDLTSAVTFAIEVLQDDNEVDLPRAIGELEWVLDELKR